MSVHACDSVDSVDACESASQSYLVFALHPAHSDVVFIGFPRPFLPKERATVRIYLIRVCVCVCVLLVLSASLVLCVCKRTSLTLL